VVVLVACPGRIYLPTQFLEPVKSKPIAAQDVVGWNCCAENPDRVNEDTQIVIELPCTTRLVAFKRLVADLGGDEELRVEAPHVHRVDPKAPNLRRQTLRTLGVLTDVAVTRFLPSRR